MCKVYHGICHRSVTWGFGPAWLTGYLLCGALYAKNIPNGYFVIDSKYYMEYIMDIQKAVLEEGYYDN